MKYYLDNNYYNDSTISILPENAVLLSDEQWNNRFEPDDGQKLINSKDKKKTELKQWKLSEIGAMLQVKSSPDYYVKPSPTENIFLAYSSMTTSQTKIWRAMDSEGVKLFNLDENGNKISPLFLELTKTELKSASDHYESRKTSIYHQHDLKLFQIDETLTTIEEIDNFDVTQIII